MSKQRTLGTGDYEELGNSFRSALPLTSLDEMIVAPHYLLLRKNANASANTAT